MSQSAAAAGADVTASASQPLLVSMLSIAVIALTALTLQRLKVPSEVTASLSTASGALVPAIAIRRRDAVKSKVDHCLELVARVFERPPIYVLIIAAGLLALVEFTVYLLGGFIGGVATLAAEEEGLLTAEESLAVFESDIFIGGIAIVSLLIVMVIAVFVGTYVAHRITRRPIVWAMAAVVLAQAVTLAVDVVALAFTDAPFNWMAYPVWVAALGIPVWLGARRGRRNRAMFLANRLFKGLSENDRNGMLALMEDAQLPQQLPE